MRLPKLKTTFLLKIIIAFLFLVSVVAPKKVFAFEEHFNGTELDNNKWQYYENDGLIEVAGGFVNLSSTGATFPYLYTKQNPFPETGDFQIKIKMQYTSLTLRGGGVVIGNFIPPNSCSVPYHDSHGKEIILFAILQDSFKHLRVVFVPCRNIDECEEKHSVPLHLEEDNTELNEFQIIYTESRYKLFFNDALIFTSNETPRRPTTLYIGNPTYHGHAYPWSSFRVDSIEVSSFTPTPTPSLDPIVLLPGLGASWNHEAMILGVHKEPEDWYMTPFVKTYDGIIQTLKNAGYKDTGDNKNLFIFNYDWRQPIETIANQLKDYIENTIDPPPETKIDLIGHSLGGMVARTYVQNNPDNQVDQLITLGSPHKGTPKVYYLWEGADLTQALSNWQRIGAGILLQLNKKGFENNVEAIRHVVPSLKDLLPTFPYLKQNGVEKPLSEMTQRNDWLEGLNQLPLPNFLISVLNTIVGIKENNTLRWISVEDRNQFDRFLGKWEDGRPVGEEFSNGDETVLVESAQLEGANVVELSGLNHGDLVETTAGQEAITDLLGLSPSEIIPAPEVTYEPSLVFQLASPAKITIYGPSNWQIGEGVENNTPNAIYSANDKLIFIPEVIEGNYEIHITPEGNGGKYRLLVGFITESGDYWKEYTGIVKVDTADIHEFWVPPSEQTEFFILLNRAKTEIFNLKRYFNKEKVPPKLRGKIESKLAFIMARVNAALDLLEEDDLDKALNKVSQATSTIEDLQSYIEDQSLLEQIRESLVEPLEEISNYLSQT